MNIIIGDFCKKTWFKKRQKVTQQQVLSWVVENFHLAREAYRKGVIYVPLPPKYFNCPIAQLSEGDCLIGRFKERIKGEEPRKKTAVILGKRMPCVAVDAVLYSSEVLKEDHPNYNLDIDYEIVTILPKPIVGDIPLPMETLLSNHFHASGGTKTNWSPERFELEVKKSFDFWKDKAYISRES